MGEDLARGESRGQEEARRSQKDVGMLGILPALKPEAVLGDSQPSLPAPLPHVYHFNHTLCCCNVY